MKNFFYDYKCFWLWIKKSIYNQRVECNEDFSLEVLELFLWGEIGVIFMAGVFVLFKEPVLIPFVYVITKIAYFSYIYSIYRKSKLHGEAFVNHKIFKQLVKVGHITFNYEHCDCTIYRLTMSYDKQSFNVGFFDFIYAYNFIMKEILRNSIHDSKKFLNIIDDDDNPVESTIKKREEKNTRLLYENILKDIKFTRAKENE